MGKVCKFHWSVKYTMEISGQSIIRTMSMDFRRSKRLKIVLGGISVHVERWFRKRR